MELLYGRAGRLTAQNGGFGPGQTDVLLIYADTYENPLRGSLSAAQWAGLFAFGPGPK